MNKREYGNFSLIIAIVLVIIICIYDAYIHNCDERIIQSTVTDKAVKAKSSDSMYLIFTTTNDGEIQVFQITDSIIQGRFDSSDVYAGIKVGETYDFTVVGLRLPLISTYPNIIKYQRKEKDNEKTKK